MEKKIKFYYKKNIIRLEVDFSYLKMMSKILAILIRKQIIKYLSYSQPEKN